VNLTTNHYIMWSCYSVCLVGKGRLKVRCGLEPRTNFFFRLRYRQKLVRIRFGCGLVSRIYGLCHSHFQYLAVRVNDLFAIVVREEKKVEHCFRTRDPISHSYNTIEQPRFIIYHRAAFPNCSIARYVGGLASSQFLRHSHPRKTRSTTQPIHVARSIQTGACDSVYMTTVYSWHQTKAYTGDSRLSQSFLLQQEAIK